MNTATCCTALQEPMPARTFASPWEALRLAVLALAKRWRTHARLRSEARALRGLSDATLRDIGLAERAPEPRYTLGVLDHERGRWS